MAENQLELIIELAEKLVGRKLSENEKFELRIKFLTESGDPVEKTKRAIQSQFSINESLWQTKLQANVDDIDRIINDIRRAKGK